MKGIVINMRIASLFAIALLVGMATAGSEVFTEISEKVSAAFDQETGTFAEGAYETLLEAHTMIGEALDEITGENELFALGALDCVVMYNLACIDAIDGNSDEAFTWLSGSVDAGYGDPDWMLEDEDLASLREDARFQELVVAATDNKEKDCNGPCSDEGSCCGSGDCE